MYFEWFFGAADFLNAAPIDIGDRPSIETKITLRASTSAGGKALDYSIQGGFVLCTEYSLDDLNHADATAVLQDLIARAPSLEYTNNNDD